MLGLGIFSSTKWSNTAGMVQIKNRPITVFSDSAHAYVADNLPLGKVAKVHDAAGTVPMETLYPTNQSLWPSAVSELGRSVLAFDGGQALDASLPQPAVKTIVAVAKMDVTTAGNTIFSGRTGPPCQLYIGGSGVFGFSGGAILAHTKAADLAWHVFVIVHNGANSVFSIDGVEVLGNAGANVPTELRFGGTSSAFSKCKIAQVQTIPRACNASERAAIVNRLKSDYGIS